ncbi:MAG TPA: peptide deformylase [Spirochaetes bacterium]|nr:peptide deformylase [Spirochaetota bacterium]
MVKRKIIVYPDPVLSLVSEEVTEIDEETQELIKDMFEAMDEEVGIGLAAPQLGVSERIMVVSIKEKNFERLAIINPVISFFSEETVVIEEGCLSIPGINMDVRRPANIILRGLARSGRLVEINATGMLARVIQHEIDHLDGVLFIDRLSYKDKKAIEANLQALNKQYSAASP